MDFVRGFLGLLCIFCAHFLGRAVARNSHPFRWALRTAVALLAVVFGGGLDVLTIVISALAGLSGAAGYWHELRPKKPEEDLSKIIFPKE